MSARRGRATCSANADKGRQPDHHADHPEIVTAAVLVIGDEILSGRTKDKNIGYIADYLTALGIDLREVRVVPDVEDEIVGALNALARALHLRVHHRRHRPDA